MATVVGGALNISKGVKSCREAKKRASPGELYSYTATTNNITENVHPVRSFPLAREEGGDKSRLGFG